MKAKELIYNLREVLKGTQSSLSDRTDQHLMYLLDEARVILASRKIQSNYDLNSFVQYFDKKPSKVTSDIIARVGNKPVLVLELPSNFASFNGMRGGFSVGSTDSEVSYSRIEFHSIKTSIYRKYTGDNPKWTIDNNKIIIINSTTGIESKIRVRGVFDEPFKIENFKTPLKKLDPFDFEYPLTLKDATAVYDILMTGELSYADITAQAVSRQKRSQRRDQIDAQKNNNAED
jgi:hypothetical protein